MKRRTFLRRFGMYLAGLPAIPTVLSAGSPPSPSEPQLAESGPVTNRELVEILREHYDPLILDAFEG